MYLRLRKRRKPVDAPGTSEKTNTPDTPGAPVSTPPMNTAPATGAQPAEPSSVDWVEADSAPGELSEGPDVGKTQHPNRGKAHESARGSHR